MNYSQDRQRPQRWIIYHQHAGDQRLLIAELFSHMTDAWPLNQFGKLRFKPGGYQSCVLRAVLNEPNVTDDPANILPGRLCQDDISSRGFLSFPRTISIQFGEDFI